MTGVTHIQVQTSLYYDDGFVVTLTSPMFKKDIRNGDYFPDNQIGEVLVEVGNEMAATIETKTAKRMHDEIMAIKNQEGKPTYYRRPDPENPFSPN